MLGRLLTIAFLALLSWTDPGAAAVYDLGTMSEGAWLGPNLEIIQDDTTDPEVLFEQKEGYFHVDQKVPSFGYTHKRYWARLKIKNPQPQDRSVYLVFKGPFEIIKLYQKDENGKLQSRETGMYSEKRNNVDYRYPAFNVDLKPGENTLIFTQDVVAPHFPVQIFSEEGFAEFRYQEHTLAAFMYGIGLVLLMFTTVTALSHPTAGRIFFACSYLASFAFSLFVTGSGRPFLQYMEVVTEVNFHPFEQFLYRNWILWWGCIEFFSVLFAWVFLEIGADKGRWTKVMVFLGLVCSFSLGTVSYFDSVLAINAFSSFYHVIVLMFAYLSFRKYREGFLPAKNSMIGWLSYTVVITIQLLYFFGQIGPSFFTSWGLMTGTIMQFFFLGLAILDKQKFDEDSLRRQKEIEQEKVVAAKQQLEVNFERLKKFSEALRVFVSPTIQLEVSLGKSPLDYEARYVNRIISFTDMRNYTSFAETLDLKTSVGVMNACFKHIMDPIFENQGEVDKLIGDAIMSVFKEMGAQNCLEAIMKGRRNLIEHNKKLMSMNLPPIKFGTGIAVGQVLSGNFGTEQKMDRTILGDSVNIAARIESETKTYGVDVLAADDFMKKIDDYEFSRPIDRIFLKGKQIPIVVHEIFGHNMDRIIDFKMSTKAALAEVLELKDERKYQDCEKLLLELISRCPPHTYKADTIMDPTLQVLLASIRNQLEQRNVIPYGIPTSKRG